MKEINVPVDVHYGWWRCQRKDCTFRRHFATMEGAIRGVGDHLRLVHQVKLVLH